ncbi:MAG: dephospho-CoA kinase [Prevotella sp.]|nr:dephospho-CoA kinase [Prevotella sp.]
MKRYCITGGIGSGKSYVCALLRKRGIEIYDCDDEARHLINTSQEIHDKLVSLIGPETYIDGKYNTAAVTQFLLASEENKQAINAIVHPAVMEDYYKSGKHWMECAILYEAHLEQYVDKVIAVTAPREVRIERIMKRDGISYERAAQWVDGQTDQDEVARRADYIIINDGQKELNKQIDKIMSKTILAISGKPGLYELVSRGKGNLIVEGLTDHKRIPAFASDRVTSLGDIAMYTEEEDMPLGKILIALRDMEKGKPSSLNYKKASGKELEEYFAKFVPTFDRDRVHSSDIKKLIQWYNILIEAGINFEEDLKPTNGENIDDRQEQE